jgi:RNA polymerase sigma-70 factor (ECF subfamily)
VTNLALRPDAHLLGADDPIPPEDRVSRDQPRTDIESVYRSKAAPLAARLSRRGASDSLDLVHDAFARLLAIAAPKMVSISRPHAYVAAISQNLQTDRGRTQGVHNSWLEDAAANGAAHHDQVVYLETRDALRRLEAAVMKLKPVTREVFLARRVLGLSYGEISQLTGLSANAIEKHMAKAIAKLSRLVDRH